MSFSSTHPINWGPASSEHSMFAPVSRSWLASVLWDSSAVKPGHWPPFLVGGPGPPLWKIWKSIGVIIPNISGKIKNVPNHQPDFKAQKVVTIRCFSSPTNNPNNPTTSLNRRLDQISVPSFGWEVLCHFCPWEMIQVIPMGSRVPCKWPNQHLPKLWSFGIFLKYRDTPSHHPF